MADEPAPVERGLVTAPAETWDVAVRRAEVIGQLAAKPTVGWEAADMAAVPNRTRLSNDPLVCTW
jgi:putative transposase